MSVGGTGLDWGGQPLDGGVPPPPQYRTALVWSEAMLGIADDEEKSQKDQVVAAMKPSKPFSVSTPNLSFSYIMT